MVQCICVPYLGLHGISPLKSTLGSDPTTLRVTISVWQRIRALRSNYMPFGAGPYKGKILKSFSRVTKEARYKTIDICIGKVALLIPRP
jgi:hypothetical protein